MQPFAFCEKDDVEGNIRLKLLQLRNRNEPEFVGIVIPNRLKEIPTNVFSQYELRKGEQKRAMEAEENGEGNLMSKRINGQKWLKQIYTVIFQKSINASNHLAYDDVVNEGVISNIE